MTLKVIPDRDCRYLIRHISYREGGGVIAQRGRSVISTLALYFICDLITTGSCLPSVSGMQRTVYLTLSTRRLDSRRQGRLNGDRVRDCSPTFGAPEHCSPIFRQCDIEDYLHVEFTSDIPTVYLLFACQYGYVKVA